MFLQLGFLALPCFLPLPYRWLRQGMGDGSGLLSDLAVGALLFGLLLLLRFRVLRAVLLAGWFALQLGAIELNAATRRLPVIQDFQYLIDPTFLAGSTDGFHFVAPYYTAILGIAVLAAVFFSPRRKVWRWGGVFLVIGLSGCLLHSIIMKNDQGLGVGSRYNPAHWLVVDALNRRTDELVLTPDDRKLLQSMQWNANSGIRLLPAQPNRNVLIVTLEGVPGIALPEIRKAAGIAREDDEMEAFGEALYDAMLVPDFAVHSHQTIRGLYAIHCGDFSKLSYGMPKAFELQTAGERADSCLPARLATSGWSTHFLQGAPLQFMNKDKAMPVMGFQEVHGVEWFQHRQTTDFIWGTTDPDFFQGAKQYISDVRRQKKPWFLSLLTVATHQPFAASDEQVHQYGSRKRAAMAVLDHSVAEFVGWLRREHVLDDTLVIFTSDESHGSTIGDWPCSWGYAAVLVPERGQLPHVKSGGYGLVDIESSVLDYLGLAVPAGIKGRSLFREYNTGRHMFSYTASMLRWQDPENGLLECSDRDSCHFYPHASMIGLRPQPSSRLGMQPQTMYDVASFLDKELQPQKGVRILEFGNGDVRDLPETIRNEWTDNLVGAQYLEFPAGSEVKVDIEVEALGDKDTTVSLRLVLRQFEKEVGGIEVPEFPVLHDKEKTSISFRFANPTKRQAFSFHLVGEGRNAKLRVQTFRITITDA